jgi:hypothetical protein
MPVYYPHSRGGAVIKKVVGILNQPSEEWQKNLKKLGLTQQDRSTILNALKVVYFNTPLKNIHLTIQKHCEDKLATITYYFPSLKPFVAETVTNFMKKRIFPLLTSFNPTDTREPIDYLNDWKNLNAVIVLHFQHADNDVPDSDNIECAKILLTVNPDKTYVIIGNDGSHGYGDITIAKVIHALNEKLGCSYLKNTELLTSGAAFLDANKPGLDTVEEHIVTANEAFALNNPHAKKPSKFSWPRITAALGLMYYLAKNNTYLVTPKQI